MVSETLDSFSWSSKKGKVEEGRVTVEDTSDGRRWVHLKSYSGDILSSSGIYCVEGELPRLIAALEKARDYLKKS